MSGPEGSVLIKLTREADKLEALITTMQRIAEQLPMTIRIEVNNLMEVHDLLRFKLHEVALARVIGDPPVLEAPVVPTRRVLKRR